MPSSRAAEVIFPSVTQQGVLHHFPLDTLPRLLQGLRRQGTQGIRQFQVPGGDALAAGQDHRTPHPVLQLAHVARPGVKAQDAQRVGREGQTGFGVLDAIVVQESLRQQDDVVPRSRSEGTLTTITARRKYRSSRNLPAATDSCRFRFVAVKTRASLATSCLPPTRWKVFS